ncbi:MAG: hypothetical protein JOY67_21695 [Hyphomicrobiales bacterium]|nr:hypothetical protein [Hyphomicrobiales bacterium]MBV9520208.1 hypothetical protein [Hyphomicrobiales bacterium]
MKTITQFERPGGYQSSSKRLWISLPCFADIGGVSGPSSSLGMIHALKRAPLAALCAGARSGSRVVGRIERLGSDKLVFAMDNKPDDFQIPNKVLNMIDGHVNQKILIARLDSFRINGAEGRGQATFCPYSL